MDKLLDCAIRCRRRCHKEIIFMLPKCRRSAAVLYQAGQITMQRITGFIVAGAAITRFLDWLPKYRRSAA